MQRFQERYAFLSLNHFLFLTIGSLMPDKYGSDFSFIDLPNLSTSIYSTELCSRLRAFLIACPPTGPSPPVAELVIATADLQRNLASWKIR